MVKGILFDLDGTLFDRDAAVGQLVFDQHVRFASVLADVPRDVYAARVLELDAHGYGDKADIYRQVVREFALPDSLAPQLTADFWRKYHAFCRPFPEVPSVLAALSSQGLKLGVVTNGSVQIQEPVVSELGIAKLISVILVSEREGVRKPHPELFHRALRMLDLRPDEVWFVGDHPQVDVDGAAAAGLSAIWRRTPHWPAPTSLHRQLETLDELLVWIQCTA
ncbi:MAG TPA: HAD family hydrolase [Polyangiaceae bacterium]